MPQEKPKKKKSAVRTSLPLAPSPAAYLGRKVGELAGKAYKAVKKATAPMPSDKRNNSVKEYRHNPDHMYVKPKRKKAVGKG